MANARVERLIFKKTEKRQNIWWCTCSLPLMHMNRRSVVRRSPTIRTCMHPACFSHCNSLLINNSYYWSSRWRLQLESPRLRHSRPVLVVLTLSYTQTAYIRPGKRVVWTRLNPDIEHEFICLLPYTHL